MQNAVEACGDKALWRWIATVQPIMRQFNEFRQWARGCPCHEAERRDGVKVECERSSRRLAEAFEKMAVLSDWVLTTERQMTPAMCEGDHDLLIETKRLLLLGHQEIEERFQWVFNPPYLFAYCRVDPDAAAVYLETAAETPFADLHRCTQYHLERFRGELERTAAGQVVVYSQAYLQEEAVFHNMPLTSDPAEGYHRNTSHTARRCPRAQLPFLLSTNRLEQNLVLAEGLCVHEEGRAQFRYNDHHFKRVLQTSTRSDYLFRSKKQPTKKTMEQVYRLRAYCHVDWSALGAPSGWKDEPAHLPLDEWTRMRLEYIDAVLFVGHTYKVERPEPLSPFIFEVIKKKSASQKSVRTIRRRTAHHHVRSLLVQPYSVWPGAAPTPNVIVVYEDGDPVYMSPLAISDFVLVLTTLSSYTVRVSAVAFCYELVDPSRSIPRTTVMDPKHPTISVIQTLSEAGWQRVNDRVVHTADNLHRLQYGCKQIASKKLYLQCCLVLRTVFSNGQQSVPSDEPQSFYDLLIRGRVVEPGRGDRVYRALLHGRAIPDDAPPAAPQAAAAAPAPAADVAATPAAAVAAAEVIESEEDDADEEQQSASSTSSSDSSSTSPSSSSDSDSSISESESEVAEPEPAPALLDIPEFLDGARLRGDQFRDRYTRYVLTCPYHHNCVKKRQGHERQTANLGPYEPLGFLGAWLARAGEAATAQQHVHNVKPRREEIRAWLQDHGYL